MQRFAGVLLEVQALDAYPHRLAVGHIDDDFALADDRGFVLADLIALRQIGIKVVLPVEHRFEIDLCLEPKPGADRLAHALGIDHRQHSRHGGVDQRDMGVGLAAEFGGSARKQFGAGIDLGMDLHADHDFPIAG